MSGKLFDLLSIPCIQAERWSNVTRSIRELAQSLQKYAEYLQSTTECIQKMHQMMELVRTPHNFAYSSVRRVDEKFRSAQHTSKYAALEKELAQSEPYANLVFLNGLAPVDRRARYDFMQEFVLPFAVEMYSYSSGGSLSTFSWVWKALLILQRRTMSSQ